MERIKRFLRDEAGATAVEYGIMLAAIAAIIVATVFSMGEKVLTLFQSATTGW